MLSLATIISSLTPPPLKYQILYLPMKPKTFSRMLDSKEQYVNHEIPDVQDDLEKAEESDIKLPTSTGSSKKQESSRKISISALLTMPKPLTVWITINCGKF